MSYKSKNNIIVRGARQHNLKNINVNIPRNSLTVITGLSGSGKSSLAFDTIYAEGQRRYVESLSTYARQFLGLMTKPDVDSIEGLSPAISIEQKSVSKNPRSTVGTVTEIYDYLRLLYSRVGEQYCYKCQKPVKKQTLSQIMSAINKIDTDAIVHIIAPIIKGKKGEFSDLFLNISKQGFMRVRIDGKNYRINDRPDIDKNKKHSIDVLIDRINISKNNDRMLNSLEIASKMGSGQIIINYNNTDILYSQNYACNFCDISYDFLEPSNFSFNSPYGACQNCDGLGTQNQLDMDKIIPDKNKSLIDGTILPLGSQPNGKGIGTFIKKLSLIHDFSYTTPWKSLPEEVKDILINGISIKHKKRR